MRLTVFDIETRANADDIGWHSLKCGEGGIAAAACLDATLLYSGNSIHIMDERIKLFDDHIAKEFAQHLESADLVVSFNGTAFDLPILSSLVGSSIVLRRHYDLRAEIAAVVGQFTKGYSLAALGERVLGKTKAVDSALLTSLVVEGRYAELFQHAIDDVDLTLGLFKRVVLNNGLLEDVQLRNPKELLNGKEEV